MRLTPHEKDNARYVALALMILVAIASVVMAFLLGQSAYLSLNQTLAERSGSIAAGLGPSQIAKLSGTADDAKLAEYTDLKAQLAEIKKSNPDARSVYIMGQRSGQLFFYVDSEQTNSSQYSPPGYPYPDGTTADHAIFDNGNTFVEGPTPDSYGTFVSGLSPIFKPGTRQVLAVVGIDVGSDIYWHDIVLSASVPLLAGGVTILIIWVFERVRRHNAQLLALKSELVSVASHELRNPITGIRWAAESLQKFAADDRSKRMAQAIADSAKLLQASTNDILELSHATNGRSLTITPTDMLALMHDVITAQTLSAQQRNISVVMDESWPATLMLDVDADQLKRAIHNVVSNAIKYTRDNTQVTISYAQDDKHVYIKVADQGIGIPAAEQSKVFRGFYRASNAVKSNTPGTGLGLYLVKTVLNRHGGSVSFASQENKGTVFTLTLPRRHSKAEPKHSLNQFKQQQ